MVDFDSLQTHLNRFNKAVTDLLSVDVKVEEDDKNLLLIGSTNKSYESLGKAFLYGKDSVAYEDVVAALLSDELMSNDSN